MTLAGRQQGKKAVLQKSKKNNFKKGENKK